VYLGQAKNDGNGKIWTCHIESDFAIPTYWKLAAKTQKGETIALRKMRFKAKAMALRSSDEGCIKWSAICPNLKNTLSSGMGGTIREMLNNVSGVAP
jgi:hypothetical protein